ncbi:hypothetical protein DAEQUDRAFT_180254 [Daedalea quercina L-15889]|uniref:Uncharacterized protein n=1 Tax=Daedalea quercina L-15889 TaxID=1314783 RepID=A0A165REQ8_9APHY|nr:hypothetical protein DAEQUDRAFT_180254 [Daedalea quercina L-15889]
MWYSAKLPLKVVIAGVTLPGVVRPWPVAPEPITCSLLPRSNASAAPRSSAVCLRLRRHSRPFHSRNPIGILMYSTLEERRTGNQMMPLHCMRSLQLTYCPPRTCVETAVQRHLRIEHMDSIESLSTISSTTKSLIISLLRIFVTCTIATDG